MHPFVRLMRAYCIDYTNSHDQSVCDDFMDDTYVVNSFGMQLPRDEAYKPGVAMIFDTAPGLGLVVHEFVLNGDRLAMHFSEHAAMTVEGDRRELTCWRGIGLYKWNGTKLVENWVEQDYFSMRRQVATRTPDPILPPHLDPWMWTQPVDPDPTAEEVVRAWLQKGDLADAADVEIDDTRVEGVTYEPIFDVTDVVVDDLFSAGSRVPFHVTLTGTYRGGLGEAYEPHLGRTGVMGVSGFAHVDGGSVAKVEAVTCKVQAISTLTGGPLDLGF
ncbi:MAG: ester cyclase [Actinomycetota bacterium]|nr:ester cyclase [Actinomycetota bacterium]